MDDAQKKALIKKLSAAKNFDARYSEENRKWFVGKVIDALLSRSVADADVERLTNDIIKKANTELKDRITKGFASTSLKTKWTGYKAMTSRTQIIYGMIAMHPEFLLEANKNYFDFILERRFRSIQRMAFYVNSDAGNIFAYPNRRATPPEKMKVNVTVIRREHA